MQTLQNISDNLKIIISDFMRRFIYFIFIAFSVFSCGKEVDYDPDWTNDVTRDYIIRNDLDLTVSIVDKYSLKEDGTRYNIPGHDSIVRRTNSVPFGGMVFVVIDDTLVFRHDTINRHYNVGLPSSYDTIEVGDNYYKMRYVIDEDFYEYAKAHPYRGE